MRNPIIGQVSIKDFIVYKHIAGLHQYDHGLLPVGALVSYNPSNNVFTALDGPFKGWTCLTSTVNFRPLSPLELLAMEAK